jgi:hypothetical protein
MTPAPTAALACVVKLLAEQIAGAKEHEGAGVALLMDEAEAILQQLRGAAAMRDALAGLMAVYDEGGAGNNYWSEEEPLWEAARNALAKGAGDGK